MFRRIALADEAVPVVEIFVDGLPVAAREGDTLAAAMLDVGLIPFRTTPVSRSPRAPLCLMGVCFDCLVEVDGRTEQACMVPVRAGMQVHRPDGARELLGVS